MEHISFAGRRVLKRTIESLIDEIIELLDELPDCADKTSLENRLKTLEDHLADLN